MDSISLLFHFAVAIPAVLAARIWWLDKRCDDALAVGLTDRRNGPHNFTQESTR